MTTRLLDTPDDRRTIPRAVRALVLVSLAVAAQASGQALPSPSPSPPELASKFRVLQTDPKRAVHVNEIVDLGTLRVREQAAYDFLLAPVRPLISGGGGESVQVGLSVDNPAVQVLPSEVTVPSSGRAPFEIKVNARWLGVGTHVFEIEVTDLDDPSVERPFRIQVTVLDDATIQDAISTLYERYRLYTVGSSKTVTIALSQFETFPRAKLAEFGALDLATMPGGQTLEFKLNYLGSSREGERIVTSPLWRDAGDFSQSDWMQVLQGQNFLEAIELESGLRPHTRATRYRVDVSLDGQSRSYFAVVLWGGGGRLEFLDFITPGVYDIAGFRTQPGISSTLLVDTFAEEYGADSASHLGGALRSEPLSIAGQAGVRQCEDDRYFDRWDLDDLSDEDHRFSGDGDVGHGTEGEVSKRCFCETDCQTRCTLNSIGVGCVDIGPPVSGYHKTKIVEDQRIGNGQSEPALCTAAVHCDVLDCPSPINCEDFSLGISIADTGGVSFSHGGASPDWTKHKVWSKPCRDCRELFEVTVQVEAGDPDPFQGGDSVTVTFESPVDTVAGEKNFAEPGSHNFGRFKQGPSYAIKAVGDDCMDCQFSNAPTTGTIQGPLNFKLTCSQGDDGLSESAPNRAAAGSGSCGEYPVRVEVGAECLFCPAGFVPDLPTMTATLSAPPNATQMMPIDEGTQSFPEPLTQGTQFDVTFSNPPFPWNCFATNTSGRIAGGPAVVPLSCLYVSPPDDDNCSLWPPACVAPQCGYVWIHIGDLVVTQWLWLPTNPSGPTPIAQNSYPVYQRVDQCSGLVANSSPTADRAPLVILRNSEDSEYVGPSVPIEGLARDDSSTVTGVEIFVDGQAATPSDFQFNQLDVYTCDEIPELEPGQPCNYNSRFSGSVDVSGFGPGTYPIHVYATNAEGLVGYTESYLTIVEPEPNDPDALEVTDHPDNASVFVGEGTSWSVTATGGVPPYSYTWEAMGPQATVFEPVGNCCNTTGSSTRTLVLHYAEPQYDGSRVRCRIEDSAGNTVVSHSAYLWTREPLQIAAHPEDVTVSPGEDANFSVDAYGGEPPYAYQWHFIHPAAPGTALEIEGEVAPMLTVESTSSGMDGVRYLCRVTDSAGQTEYSHSALLLVE